MAASIRSKLYTSPVGPQVGATVTGASRNDLTKGYRVVCDAAVAATTYNWSLAFTPDSPGPAAASGLDFTGTASAASLLPPENSNSSSCKFDVDWDGSYLVRLVVDSGLPTESTQFVRLRALTTFANLKLVAAGERRDQFGVVPVDATPEGWSDDQNQNLLRLMLLVRRVSTSGRVLFVDANRGRYTVTSQAQNDPANILRIPGPDSAARDESGMRMRAVGFGDFSSIQEAIDYASAAASRGEPAPSSTNPYIVKIQAGSYAEDLSLAPWVFLDGAGTREVLIYTTSGSKHHTFSATGANDLLVLSNLTLVNTQSTTSAIIEAPGGQIVFLDVDARQDGNNASQGGVLHVDDTYGSTTLVNNCNWYMDTAATPQYCVVLDANTGSFVMTRSSVRGPSGLLAISDPLAGASTFKVYLDASKIEARLGAGYALRGFPNVLKARWTEVIGRTVIDDVGLGVAAFPHDVTVETAHLHLVQVAPATHAISVDGTGTSGSCTISLGAHSLSGTWDVLTFPSAPGSVPTVTPNVPSRTVYFDNNYTRPENTGAGSLNPTVQLPVDNVQEALSLLTRYVLPQTVSPYYSLESAYNGLSALFPPTLGSGLGRTIQAGAGAVQIERAVPPVLPIDSLLLGGLQVEGQMDIGPLVGDGLGSEFGFFPNTLGMGPILKMGRSVYPNVTGLSAAAMINVGSGQTAHPFMFAIHTANGSDAGAGARGAVALVAGTGVGATPPSGGALYLQGGFKRAVGAGEAGSVWVMPGFETGASAARMQLVKPDTATPATLVAGLAFNAASTATGYVYIQTLNGVEKFQVLHPDTLGDLVTRINASSLGVIADTVGGTKLRLRSLDLGAPAFILFLTDDQSGALNTKVGDLTLPAATYTAGSYVDYVGVSCTANGNLHIHGSLTSDVPVGGGGFTYQGISFPGATVGSGNRIVGVDTSAGGGGTTTVSLPAIPTVGDMIVVKHETGTLGLGIPLQELVIDPGANTIDGAAGSLTYNAPADDLMSLSFYWNGSGWYIY